MFLEITHGFDTAAEQSVEQTHRDESPSFGLKQTVSAEFLQTRCLYVDVCTIVRTLLEILRSFKWNGVRHMGCVFVRNENDHSSLVNGRNPSYEYLLLLPRVEELDTKGFLFGEGTRDEPHVPLNASTAV
ncbi:hypothetical protein V1478_005970 [Vespula squamosa]|uniref:Uncharacterized protein n=1 Tax=Vespula squamosa TaxID=30214 RepID=A0ABD2B8X2_VESSQ